MSVVQKVGKQKKMIRSGREKAHNVAIRNDKVNRARARHLKNALRSCGALFAQELKKYYAQTTPAPKKVEK